MSSFYDCCFACSYNGDVRPSVCLCVGCVNVCSDNVIAEDVLSFDVAGGYCMDPRPLGGVMNVSDAASML